MIISRTPHRISFFGGGTDYPDYYLKHGGKVLGAAIDKYCYLSVRRLPPFFEHKHRIVYSKMENVNTIDEIVHPAVRETLKYLNVNSGVSVHHDGDIPARSGMGSSSSFTVGMLNTMYALEGKRVSKEELTKEAIYIEQELIKENVGSQDQTLAAHGGFNLIKFSTSGEISVVPVIVRPDQLKNLEKSLVLVFTGISRMASVAAGDKIKNIPNNKGYLSQMKDLVDDAYRIITTPNKNLCEFGELLNETWKLKKKLSNEVTNPQIEELYDIVLKNGGVGGKLCGAGGGGFMLFFVEPENRAKVIKALKNYLLVPFNFDYDGSKIIVYNNPN
jgi:D-glycero-alpha-D-manno-heptose-7-phosphate kinase